MQGTSCWSIGPSKMTLLQVLSYNSSGASPFECSTYLTPSLDERFVVKLKGHGVIWSINSNFPRYVTEYFRTQPLCRQRSSIFVGELTQEWLVSQDKVHTAMQDRSGTARGAVFVQQASPNTQPAALYWNNPAWPPLCFATLVTVSSYAEGVNEKTQCLHQKYTWLSDLFQLRILEFFMFHSPPLTDDVKSTRNYLYLHFSIHFQGAVLT